MLHRWSHLVVRRPWRVVVAVVVLLVIAGTYGLGVFDRLASGGFTDPGTDSARAAETADDLFGPVSTDVLAVYTAPEGARVDDTGVRTAIEDVVASLPDEAVAGVRTWYGTDAPGLVSEDRRTTAIAITLDADSDSAVAEAYAEVEPLLAAEGLETDVGGPAAVFADVNDQVSADIVRAETISIPIVLVLSLLIFGSLVAAVIPAAIGVVAIVGSFAVVRLMTEVTEVSAFAINIITLLGLGLAIDYALFVISRFRQELSARHGADGRPPREVVDAAVTATLATAGRTVLFSGLTVAAALSSMLVFPQTFLRSMAIGGIAAVGVAMIASLTLLPAVLRLLGGRIEAGAMPWRRRGRDTGPSPRWGAFARLVMRRPVAWLVATSAVLLLLAAPFLQAEWGSVDERVLPADAPSRVASDLAADRLGGSDVAHADVVLTGATAADGEAYAADVRDTVEGVSDATVVGVSDASSSAPAALVDVTWSDATSSAASQALVGELREVPTPDGVSALVGGETAQTVDLVDSIGTHLPWMVLVVVVVMLVLLFVAFGSIVMPLKAIAVNALSIGASFGIVTWIFQDGNLSGLLGFEPLGYLEATQPILMLAILFGLSMDYEVFLLSRVREAWDRTGDNRLSVETGVSETGRIITGAALLLAVVIGAFATSQVQFMQMIGVGMLVALFIDATLVRLIIVPAAMALLGDSNWWAPGPLRRWWERYGVREGSAPEPVRVGDGASGDGALTPA